MAAAIIEVDFAPGQTLTLDLIPWGTDTLYAANLNLSEKTNDKGSYRVTVNDPEEGSYRINLKLAGDVVSKFRVDLVNEIGVYVGYEWAGLIYTGILMDLLSLIKSQTDQMRFSGGENETKIIADAHAAAGRTVGDVGAGNEAHFLQAADSGDNTVLRKGSGTVTGTDLALEATLTAMKGAGWTTETLKAIKDAILSSQAVRDAMKLAPTAGDPAAGSVDKHLDDILEDTATTIPAAIAALPADKEGYSLSATGLDAIADPDDLTPGEVPATFTQKLRWFIQRFWKADKSATTITVKNEAGDTITTQAITSSGNDQTTGAPS